jgi:hypothetical protein
VYATYHAMMNLTMKCGLLWLKNIRWNLIGFFHCVLLTVVIEERWRVMEVFSKSKNENCGAAVATFDP